MFLSKVTFDEKDLSKSKLEKLRKFPELIDALYFWIAMGRYESIPDLIELARQVKLIYRFVGKKELYRGFRPKFNGQNNMGLASNVFLIFNKTNNIHFGKVYQYSGDKESISFTTEIDVARGFGGTIIRFQADFAKDNLLVITDELMYLVCEKHNFELQSQREVVLLPPFNIEFDVIEHNGKTSPSWTSW